MASPSTTYAPRQPASGILYQVVRDHFETFRAEAALLRDGEGLPGFVEQEFRDFLRCGSVGGGFAQFRLVVDGVLTKAGEEARFHPCPWLDAADVDEVLATVEAPAGWPWRGRRQRRRR